MTQWLAAWPATITRSSASSASTSRRLRSASGWPSKSVSTSGASTE